MIAVYKHKVETTSRADKLGEHQLGRFLVQCHEISKSHFSNRINRCIVKRRALERIDNDMWGECLPCRSIASRITSVEIPHPIPISSVAWHRRMPHTSESTRQRSGVSEIGNIS